jgi:hypothetical protein
MCDHLIVIQQESNIKTEQERKWGSVFTDAPTYNSINLTRSVGHVTTSTRPQHEVTGEYRTAPEGSYRSWPTVGIQIFDFVSHSFDVNLTVD